MFDYYLDRSSPILVNFGSRGVTAAALLLGVVGIGHRGMGIQNWGVAALLKGDMQRFFTKLMKK